MSLLQLLPLRRLQLLTLALRTLPVAQDLYRLVALVAPTPLSVLINGASGTGKEYVAHRIHELSKRVNGPFVAIDCGALTKELAASELFGHTKEPLREL